MEAEPPLGTYRPDRLLELAAFLRYQVPEQAFCFSVFMQISPGGKQPVDAFHAGGGCGTVGCAIGWLPMMYPSRFTWVRAASTAVNLDVVLTDNSSMNYHAAADFFGITISEATLLFMPWGVMPTGDGEQICNNLGANATPDLVAQNIERFVKVKEKNSLFTSDDWRTARA